MLSTKRSPLLFFLLVFALSSPVWLIGAVSRWLLLPGVPASGIMAMCSALAAALLIYREGGISAITTLFKRSFDYTCITSSVWLLPMLLLQDSRRAARTSATGELILLEDQDRSLWNREQIAEGVALVQRAFSIGQVGPYTVQAAIAAVHAQAPTAAATDWNQIVELYGLLLQAEPSPVIELNRAVAVAMRDGPLAGLELVDAILKRGDLDTYHLAHAARADLCRRLGRTKEARLSYQRALSLTQQDPERRFLEHRLSEL